MFIRPFALELVRQLKRDNFEVILFTAGNRFYMESIMDLIFQPLRDEGIFFDHCLCREEMVVLANLET